MNITAVAGALERRFGLARVTHDALLAAARELCASPAEVEGLARLIETADVRNPRIRKLLEQVIIGESYFWRTPEHFEAVAALAPRLLEARGSIEAWSCGCAAGEEAYSLAIALFESLGARAPITVYGTDVHASPLERAVHAPYFERSLRALPSALRSRWLEEAAGGMRPNEQLRRATRFWLWNVLDGPFGGRTFDIVFCRNVLIYQSPRATAWSTRSLAEAVRPGGLLVTGGADMLYPPPGFRMIEIERAVILERIVSETKLDPSLNVSKIEPPPRTSSKSREAAPADKKPAADPLALGRALLENGLLREAEAQLRITCSMSEPSAEALFLLARLLADTARRTEACSVLKSALALDPAHVPATHLMALIFEEVGDLDGAEDQLRRALCADPDFAQGHVAAGALYLKIGERARALKHLDVAEQLTARTASEKMMPGAHPVSAGWLKQVIAVLRNAP